MKGQYLHAKQVATACSLLLVSAAAFAAPLKFSTFTPLASSATATSDGSKPITFGNPDIQQRSIADRTTQLADGKPNSGNWDMNTVNETPQLGDGHFDA